VPNKTDPRAAAGTTPQETKEAILTVNAGSSSIKFALFEAAEPPRRLLAGEIERIGLENTILGFRDMHGQETRDEPFPAADLHDAGQKLIDWLDTRLDKGRLAGVGHRLVHGGPHFFQAQRVTPEMIAELRCLAHLDPDHLPGELTLLQTFVERHPEVPQIACFDTAFHHDLPRVAQLLPVPRSYEAAGVRKYGFHGLSYAYLLEELARLAGPEAARGRLVLAHLGSGASLAAVREGRCLDTTMSFTPAAGLVMGTRSGDLDPGFLIYLMRCEGMTAGEIDDLVNRRSGLLGVSGLSSDMRDLLNREDTDPAAADAVELFCYQARKYIAAMVAAAGGLDTLVFSAGIGERSAVIRARICAGLEFLGVQVDPARNASHAPVISPDDNPVTVRVIPTDEEITILQETLAIISGRGKEAREKLLGP
jgi:acetate kinase